MVRPDDSFLYATKAYGGHLYSEMTHYLHDVAGGAVITAPSIADLDNPETGAHLRKYMQTMAGVPGEDRVRIFHVIRDPVRGYLRWLGQGDEPSRGRRHPPPAHGRTTVL
jgi:aromatic ring hydroxylase